MSDPLEFLAATDWKARAIELGVSNELQARFVDAFFATGENGTQAAILAGYSKGRAKQTAHELLKKAHILDAVKRQRENHKIVLSSRILIKYGKQLESDDPKTWKEAANKLAKWCGLEKQDVDLTVNKQAFTEAELNHTIARLQKEIADGGDGD